MQPGASLRAGVREPRLSGQQHLRKCLARLDADRSLGSRWPDPDESGEMGNARSDRGGSKPAVALAQSGGFQSRSGAASAGMETGRDKAIALSQNHLAAVLSPREG